MTGAAGFDSVRKFTTWPAAWTSARTLALACALTAPVRRLIVSSSVACTVRALGCVWQQYPIATDAKAIKLMSQSDASLGP